MLRRVVLTILLQGLTLLWLGPACKASSLGAVVHVVPLDSSEGKTVRAHFIVIAPNPCPDFSGVCATGEDCMVHPTSSPFSGTKPTAGWCVRQWQKTISSNYNATVKLGSKVDFYVSLKAGPKLRPNTGRLNQPPYVALPPPLRARVNCPHHIPLSVKDLDGDKVRCRFARADRGECLNCSQHSFIELNEEKCMLAFTGEASVGQYSIVLMVEDISHVEGKPLSSIPVHLSLTVEEASSSCSAEPVATSQTPRQDATLYVLPYEKVDITVNFISELESVIEIAMVGPPALFRFGLKTTAGLSTMTMAWVRGQNKLAPLLPICFAANTNSLQSDPRCLWLYQKLKCSGTEMSLVLPVGTLKNINLGELQLNSPTCPVTYNNTHLTAHIPLAGCGTKKVHFGSELIYTNTLQSVRPYTVVSRLPSLILPLACRIPGLQVRGPQYKIIIPSERETFGAVAFRLEIYLPGEGPFSNLTRSPTFRHLRSRPSERVQRDVALFEPGNGNGPRGFHRSTGSKIDSLDLHVLSNCSVDRAELMVGKCMESETEDFVGANPILDQGCLAANSTLEIVTSTSNSRVYRLDMSTMKSQGTMMFVECTVYLCIATLPSQKCPDPCDNSTSNKTMTDKMITRSYTIRSGAISLVVTTAAPTITAAVATAAAAPAAPAAAVTSIADTTAVQKTTSSNAPEASAMTVGVILAAIHIYHQNIFLY
ncbi:uncharacterized protein ACJ7VT_019220 isoform 2-T2 [Polymixia lowei]